MLPPCFHPSHRSLHLLMFDPGTPRSKDYPLAVSQLYTQSQYTGIWADVPHSRTGRLSHSREGISACPLIYLETTKSSEFSPTVALSPSRPQPHEPENPQGHEGSGGASSRACPPHTKSPVQVWLLVSLHPCTRAHGVGPPTQ